jgi:predicted dehydrogenase
VCVCTFVGMSVCVCVIFCDCSCHFFDLMRLITGKEVQLDKIQSIVQRGINYNDEELPIPVSSSSSSSSSQDSNDGPIIDSAYVILPFVTKIASDKDDNTNSNNNINSSNNSTIGCLELCMFAEGSRHQEEIIVTGPLGRLEAYLPENKVYAYKRPTNKEWSDRTVPPSYEIISERNTIVYDCSNVKDVHNIDTNDTIPTHGGYHYSSTAVEWYKLLQAMDKYKKTGIWDPLVSLQDGLDAVEIGLHATQQSIY